MTIIFFGSDLWFSEPVLAALAAAGHEILLVVSKGEMAAKFKVVDAKTPEDISRQRLESLIRSDLPRSDPIRSDLLTPDAIILASFGPPFLAAEILNWPKYSCLNVHASLLPRWRGASPVFAAIAAGDKETGVSIMRMTEEIDRGPVLGQKKIEIRQPGILRPGLATQGRAFSNYDTRETLTKKLGKLGGELIVEKLKKLERGQITEMKQPRKSPTPYTRRLTKETGRIDWSKSPIEIERFIRAVTPWPGAWTLVQAEERRKKEEERRLKILKAHLEQETRNKKQETMKLVIDLVQLPGKNPISWKQFAAGH